MGYIQYQWSDDEIAELAENIAKNGIKLGIENANLPLRSIGARKSMYTGKSGIKRFLLLRNQIVKHQENFEKLKESFPVHVSKQKHNIISRVTQVNKSSEEDHPVNKGKEWSKPDIAIVVDMFLDGFYLKDITSKVGRTESGVLGVLCNQKIIKFDKDTLSYYVKIPVFKL